MSTYSSLDVWRTLGRRHGIEGCEASELGGLREEDRDDGPPIEGAELSGVNSCLCPSTARTLPWDSNLVKQLSKHGRYLNGLS